MGGAFSPLEQWGVSGFFILVLAGVVVYQNKKIEKLYAEKNAIQEERIAKTRDTLEKYVATMGDFSQTGKLLLAKLDGSGK